ncbi:MAG TPA: hypothetical protein VFV27_10850 [Nevskiaceae bacterium]|nr:hypothetical protein [Nevskiaceae bacterium]
MTAPPAGSSCALCARTVRLTFHHLIPRRLHRRPAFQRRYGREQLARQGVWLCRSCHDAVHQHFDEMTLGRELNTLEALQAQPVLQRHAAWAARQRGA